MKLVKPSRPETAAAALWTPWGLETPVERAAQKAAVRRLLRKLADRRRRDRMRLVTQ